MPTRGSADVSKPWLPPKVCPSIFTSMNLFAYHRDHPRNAIAYRQHKLCLRKQANDYGHGGKQVVGSLHFKIENAGDHAAKNIRQHPALLPAYPRFQPRSNGNGSYLVHAQIDIQERTSQPPNSSRSSPHRHNTHAFSAHHGRPRSTAAWLKIRARSSASCKPSIRAKLFSGIRLATSIAEIARSTVKVNPIPTKQ